VITGGIAFSSKNQRRVQFGLGKSAKVDKAEIIWPGGNRQIIDNPEADRIHQIREMQ
jgi:hypothetical protein